MIETCRIDKLKTNSQSLDAFDNQQEYQNFDMERSDQGVRFLFDGLINHFATDKCKKKKGTQLLQSSIKSIIFRSIYPPMMGIIPLKNPKKTVILGLFLECFRF